MKTLERFSQFVSNTFAIWVIIFATFAFYHQILFPGLADILRFY